MIITQKKLSDLHKPAHNIRRHSEKQLHEYARSIEMFGQVKPLVVAEDGEIIAGNGLYEALLRMGRETCDCYVMVGLTDVQKKKLMMADNKVYELGFTDVDVIEELVKELDGDVDVPGWDAKVTLGFEEAQIALRTRFQETPDSLYAMKLVNDISLGAKVIYNDNGVATTVTTQKGVALQTNEQIRPIVKLRPYRTFQEVEQPESTFLIRISDRGISFIEADGGMWRLTARNTIKAFLEENLAAEIESGKLVVAL